MAKKATGVLNFNEESVIVESRLGFKPDSKLFGGLCMATIESIALVENEVSSLNEDGTPNTWEFAGLVLPNFLLTLKQVNPDATDSSERFIELRKSVPSAKNKQGVDVKIGDWTEMISNIWKVLQHITNVLYKAGVIKKDKPKLPILNYEDPAEKRVADFKKFNAAYVELLSEVDPETKEPLFKKVKLYVRVIADPKKGTFYIIPDYVNKGIFEVVDAAKKPSLELQPGDSIVLQKKADKKEDGSAKDNLEHKDVDVKPSGIASANADTDSLIAQMMAQ